MDNILKLVSDEVDRRVYERLSDYTEINVQVKLSEFAVIISRRHNIPLNLILRDIPLSKSGTCLCKGVKRNGTVCTRFVDKGKEYCGFHDDQKERFKSLCITHSDSSSQLHDNAISRNQLIELQSIL